MGKTIGEMKMAQIYQLYLQKVARKGHTQAELDTVLSWLTGLSGSQLHALAPQETIAQFCERATWAAAASQISGMICGVRVETIEDPLMRRVREMDKVVDELAKGRAMSKIMRPPASE